MENFHIEYEDDNIIVVYKAAGLPVETGNILSADLESLIKNYLALSDNTKDPYLAVINRIDQPVEGLVLFAKNKAAAAFLSKELSDNHIEKVYQCVCLGTFEDKKGTLTNYICKDSKTKKALISEENKANFKKAVLHYQVLGEATYNDTPLSLLEIHLETGRFHQIRAQLSYINHPILGDKKYGNSVLDSEFRFPALCSCELSFTLPKEKNKFRYKTAPKHRIFKEFLQK